ncbi:MAG: thioredoxin-like domain-containing protein [Anaerolineales bacterium]
MKNLKLWTGIAGALLLAFAMIWVLAPSDAVAQDDAEFTFRGETRAPEFPIGLNWLNVEQPLTMADLEGKIVLLDFWTYGCINCIHVIPDLHRLEAEYPEELVVIGVHSAKFDNEGVTENIRQIVQRYEVTHPVVNDANMDIWRLYSARAWPSIYLIDPYGDVVGRHEGEGVYEALAPVIETMAEEYRAAGAINPTPIPLAPEMDDMADTPLRFPGKVVVDEPGNRLFIADTGHNRIIVARLDNYEVQQIIGTGAAGMTDGPLDTATFNTPHGMELVGNTLYVADTDNHAIRAVDLEADTVTRVAGTGAITLDRPTEGDALAVPMRSPWDVTHHDGVLYIAMAGSHQLWQMNLADDTVAPFAGTGREDLIDGLRLTEAELAQPSGVATDGDWVYFADSESSSLRRAQIAEGGVVETLLGPVDAQSGRLFIYGDADGQRDEALLQHPLGVTISADGLVYFADTYNNKIKVYDPARRFGETFVGDARGGYFDGTGDEALFDEPGGVAYYNGRLFVADTNNHALRVVDIDSRNVSTVIFPNVNRLLPPETAITDEPLISEPPQEETAPSFDDLMGNGEIMLAPQTVAPGTGTIVVNPIMPTGYGLNDQAPFTAIWAEDAIATIPAEQRDYRVVVPDLPIEFPVDLAEGETTLSVDLTIYWCEYINYALCFVERGTVQMPIIVDETASNTTLQLDYTLVPPEFPEDSFGGS